MSSLSFLVCLGCQVARRHGINAVTVDGDRVSHKGVITGGFQDPQRFVRLALAEVQCLYDIYYVILM